MQRFLIIAGHFDYFGGAERQAILLAQELIQSHNAHVQLLGWGGNGVFADHVRSVGATPVVFPFDINQRGIAQKVKLLRLAAFIRRTLRPDYLLPFVGIHCKIIGSIWKLTGAKFCWWNQRDEGRGIHGTAFERRLLKSLPAVVSNSWEGRDFLIEKFQLPVGRVRVINNGIKLPSPRDRMAARATLGIQSSDLMILMMANLTAFKDHETLLRAFSVVRGSPGLENAKLFFVGRHEETTVPLKALAFDLGLSNCVRMPGATCDVDNVYSAADFVVHSSTREGCPNGVLEAMAHGLCVLGTDIPGMHQALGGSAAEQFLAPPGNHQQLATLMKRVACDPQLRAEAGAANRTRIQYEFSVAKMTNSVLKVIEETAQTTRSNGSVS